MRKTAILFCLILHFVCSSSLFAQEPPETDGLNYLTATQSPDGSWGNEATGKEILPSTIATIVALKALNQTNTRVFPVSVREKIKGDKLPSGERQTKYGRTTDDAESTAHPGRSPSTV